MSAPTRTLPSPSDERAWTDIRVVHRLVHPVAQPDCDICPAVSCPCGGGVRCPDAFEHRREYAGSEMRWPR